MGKLLVGLALTISMAGCGGAGAQSFVGSVQGTEALVAVVADGDLLLAYVCDGTPAGATIAEWMEGSLGADGTFTLTGQNGVVLSGRIAQDSLTATIMIAGTPHEITAAIADPPAGLFRDETSVPGSIGGWIVAPDGEQRGAIRQGTSILSPRDALTLVGGVPQPVNVDGLGRFEPIMVIAVSHE